MNKNILVTGGCGFVGSNLVKELLNSGYSVTVLDNFSHGQLDYLDGLDVKVARADIREIDCCAPYFERVDMVVHLAAFGSVVQSVADPVTNFEMNVLGTFNMLKLSAEAKVSKFVFSSTGGALIGDAVPPVNEQSLPKPISPYGAGKLCCEAYCSAFYRSYGLSTVSLRFANVYGENSLHKQGVMNNFARKLVEGKPLTIFGDGSATRDYIHVSDLCSGIRLALENDSVEHDVIHLATGHETSIKDLAMMFLDFEGLDESRLEFKPSRVGEVERNFALYGRASEKLGYAPKVSLEEGLRETYQYLRRNYEII